MNNPPRFDKLWHDLLKYKDSMRSHADDIWYHTRLFRRYAYRFAQTVIAVREHHHNELLAMLDGMKTNIDSWLDGGFRLIEDMGDNRKDLMDAIRLGMAEYEYIQHGNAWFIRKQTKKRSKHLSTKTEEIVETPLSPNLSDEEHIKVLKDQNALLLADLKGTRTALRQSQRDIARLCRENARIKTQIDRADRIIKTIKRQAG